MGGQPPIHWLGAFCILATKIFMYKLILGFVILLVGILVPIFATIMYPGVNPQVEPTFMGIFVQLIISGYLIKRGYNEINKDNKS